MKFVLAIVAALGLAYSAAGQEITAVPRLSKIYGDEIWVMHNGHVVRKVGPDSGAVFTVRGPLGGELTLCPPGGCPPQQPPQPQPDPPQFDFPDDEPEPEPDLAPELTPEVVDDSGLVGMVLAGGGTAGTIGGLIASLIVHFRRDEDDELQEDEDETNA